MTLTQLFTAIANAIRSKKGTSDTIVAEDFPTEIASISTTPNLQSKTVTIAENTTTTIAPDSGYDGLSSVEVTTNVSSDYNAKVNGNLTYDTNNGIKTIIEEVDMDGVNLTNMRSLFLYCKNLVAVKNLNTDNTTDMYQAFYGCNSLITIPSINTKKVTDLTLCFWGCTNLINVPVLNFVGITQTSKFSNMFANCTNLSNESLNNILYSCANNCYTWLSGTKTLKQLGISSTQATTCQSLSNWNDFVAAGWSTGY